MKKRTNQNKIKKIISIKSILTTSLVLGIIGVLFFIFSIGNLPLIFTSDSLKLNELKTKQKIIIDIDSKLHISNIEVNIISDKIDINDVYRIKGGIKFGDGSLNLSQLEIITYTNSGEQKIFFNDDKSNSNEYNQDIYSIKNIRGNSDRGILKEGDTFIFIFKNKYRLYDNDKILFSFLIKDEKVIEIQSVLKNLSTGKNKIY